MPQELQTSEELNKPLTAAQAGRVADIFRRRISIPEEGLTLGELARSLNVPTGTTAQVLEVTDKHAAVVRYGNVFKVVAAVVVVSLVLWSINRGASATGTGPWPVSQSGPNIASVEVPRGFTFTIAQPGASTTYVGEPKHVDMIRKDNPTFLQASLATEIKAMVQNSLNLGLHFAPTDVTVTVQTEAGRASFPVRAQPSLSFPQRAEEDRALRDEIAHGLAQGWYSLVPPQ